MPSNDINKTKTKLWNIGSVNHTKIEPCARLYISTAEKSICMGICYLDELTNLNNVIKAAQRCTKKITKSMIKN